MQFCWKVVNFCKFCICKQISYWKRFCAVLTLHQNYAWQAATSINSVHRAACIACWHLIFESIWLCLNFVLYLCSCFLWFVLCVCPFFFRCHSSWECHMLCCVMLWSVGLYCPVQPMGCVMLHCIFLCCQVNVLLSCYYSVTNFASAHGMPSFQALVDLDIINARGVIRGCMSNMSRSRLPVHFPVDVPHVHQKQKIAHGRNAQSQLQDICHWTLYTSKKSQALKEVWGTHRKSAWCAREIKPARPLHRGFASFEFAMQLM